MTDKNRDLVEELLTRSHPSNVDVTDRAAARIQTLSVEIERLLEALTMIAHHIRDESDPYEEDYWGCRSIARAALAGDGHDQ